MKKTTTIENTAAAQLKVFEALEEAISTRHAIYCNKCQIRDEFTEGDSLDAAAWFQMIGWTVKRKRVLCADCASG